MTTNLGPVGRVLPLLAGRVLLLGPHASRSSTFGRVMRATFVAGFCPANPFQSIRTGTSS